MRRRGQGLVLSKRKRRQNSNLPANIYLFKVSNRNTRKSCSDVFIVGFEHILDLFLVFLLFADFEHKILAELVSCCDISFPLPDVVIVNLYYHLIIERTNYICNLSAAGGSHPRYTCFTGR